MLNRKRVIIKDEKSKYYVGELDNGDRIKISKENLSEELCLSSKYIVSGKFRNSLLSKMLIVSDIELIKNGGTQSDYEKDYCEMIKKREEKYYKETEIEYAPSPKGLIGLETALLYHKLSSSSPERIILLNTNDNEKPSEKDNNFESFNSLILSTEDIVQYGENYTLTTPNRTICEMIINDRSEDLIIEALAHYIYDGRDDLNINSLYECANKYGVFEQVMHYASKVEWV